MLFRKAGEAVEITFHIQDLSAQGRDIVTGQIQAVERVEQVNQG